MSFLPLPLVVNCALTVVLVKIYDYLFKNPRGTREMYLHGQRMEILLGLIITLRLLLVENWSEYEMEMAGTVVGTLVFKVVYAYWKFGEIGLWMAE